MENQAIPMEKMKEALSKAPASDLFKMLVATTIRVLAAEGNENISDYDKDYLGVELKVISDEVDKRFPVKEPSRIVTA